MSSEGFSALEKTVVTCPQRAVLSVLPSAHTYEYNSPMQIVMAVWRNFILNLNLLCWLTWVWEPAEDYNGFLSL
jgi:hypothetical protein